MTILLDTNVLLRFAEPGHLHHRPALRSLDYHTTIGNTLCVVPQTLTEYWTVATRPTNVNGLGLSPTEARRDIESFRRRFDFHSDRAGIYLIWEDLVERYQCRGKATYDARLYAAMLVHDLDAILTFNASDFQRYPGLLILDPIIESQKYVP